MGNSPRAFGAARLIVAAAEAALPPLIALLARRGYACLVSSVIPCTQNEQDILHVFFASGLLIRIKTTPGLADCANTLLHVFTKV